jgi:predicted RNase H-like nuclease (RuvC/YqgF family)
VETLRNEYQDKNRIHNATSTVSRRNRDLRAGKQEKEAIENARQAAEQEKIEAARRAERENDLQKQMNRMEETMNRLEASNSALELKLAASEARADSLTAENARLMDLLFKKLDASAAAT